VRPHAIDLPEPGLFDLRGEVDPAGAALRMLADHETPLPLGRDAPLYPARTLPMGGSLGRIKCEFSDECGAADRSGVETADLSDS
jgi:hypothetical protein